MAKSEKTESKVLVTLKKNWAQHKAKAKIEVSEKTKAKLEKAGLI